MYMFQIVATSSSYANYKLHPIEQGKILPLIIQINWACDKL